jgi:hypothetical protein
MPSNEEIDKVFEALVVNGLEFIERSAEELEEEPKFSIAHFATGLELLLKARLFAEHWSLTAVNPHKCSWTGLTEGSALTIQASDLCSTIATVTGTSFLHLQETFKAVFVHRNKVLHWIPSGNIEETAAEQCRAWYHLYHLLTVTWAERFARFKERANAVDKTLLNYQPYLRVRYTQLENRLKGLKANGALFTCPACKLESGVLDNPKRRISDFTCAVCKTEGAAGRFDCSQWHALTSLPEDCSCGEPHSRAQLLDELDPASHMSPKDQLIAGQTLYSCGECLEHQTVAPVDDSGESPPTYVCVACGTQFDESDNFGQCEYCSELWVGYNTENTAFDGCEFCDGPSYD